MKKVWAILCFVGFTAFWTYGLAMAAAIFGDRLFHPLEAAACALGLIVGLYARVQVLKFTPKMHGRRARARQRLDDEATFGVQSRV